MKKEEVEKTELVFKNAIKVLKNNFNIMGIKREDIRRDCRQRIDEVLLIYSDLADISFNEAKKYFKVEDVYLKGEAEK